MTSTQKPQEIILVAFVRHRAPSSLHLAVMMVMPMVMVMPTVAVATITTTVAVATTDYAW